MEDNPMCKVEEVIMAPTVNIIATSGTIDDPEVHLLPEVGPDQTLCNLMPRLVLPIVAARHVSEHLSAVAVSSESIPDAAACPLSVRSVLYTQQQDRTKQAWMHIR